MHDFCGQRYVGSRFYMNININFESKQHFQFDRAHIDIMILIIK